MLFFLLPWLVYELTVLYQSNGFSSDSITYWLSQPITALGVLLTFIISLYHGKLGIEVIVEDYVHSQSQQTIIITLCNLIIAVCLLLLCFAIVSNLSF